MLVAGAVAVPARRAVGDDDVGVRGDEVELGREERLADVVLGQEDVRREPGEPLVAVGPLVVVGPHQVLVDRRPGDLLHAAAFLVGSRSQGLGLLVGEAERHGHTAVIPRYPMVSTGAVRSEGQTVTRASGRVVDI
jgi:hypothetical protein